jgi:hypothetical protein
MARPPGRRAKTSRHRISEGRAQAGGLPARTPPPGARHERGSQPVPERRLRARPAELTRVKRSRERRVVYRSLHRASDVGAIDTSKGCRGADRGAWNPMAARVPCDRISALSDRHALVVGLYTGLGFRLKPGIFGELGGKLWSAVQRRRTSRGAR